MNITTVAGRFQLGPALARGNMGQVYRAEDLAASRSGAAREVAVKLILRSAVGAPFDSSAAPKTVARFEREVRMMRRLDHRNLPRLIDGGVDGDCGLPYLAMELLDGRTLAELISEEPRLPSGWVAALGVQMADGLAAAHAAEVVHRDFKPANVMLLRGGLVKVLDFGLGRMTDDAEDGHLTSSGVTVGSARYMAPEQFTTSAVHQAADLYALGCVLYELLVGVPPFTSESAHELGEKHLREKVAPIGLLRDDVPAGLSRLIERLLEKDPANRPADAVEVRDGLLSFVAKDELVAGWEEFDPTSAAAVPAEAALPATVSPAVSSNATMDVFGLHRRLIDDYRAFTEAGTVIRDKWIRDFVAKDLDAKSQWPDPWLSLNPFFASGGTVLELVSAGVLHEQCARIFQVRKTRGGTTCDGRPLTLHRHQREAIDAARSGASYVLTTGTGSGKSLAYIVPIVDHVLRERASEGSGSARRVRAIIVYPMNALANSQMGELEKFLRDGFGEGSEPVTFARYTGQEDEAARAKVRENPPDILLTNYVMLELMLTRPQERRTLINLARGLEFLVFDELHTYRGRQGADVAMLIRRVREACETTNLQCVGTSATMATEGSLDERKAVVARVASLLFGVEVSPQRVIGETLVRATEAAPDVVPAARIGQEAPQSYEDLRTDPLARWIESRFGLVEDASGILVRRDPTRIEDAAAELAQATRVEYEACADAIRRTLEAGSLARHPVTERPLFAFRLHQFLSKGDTVYVTLENPGERYLTRDYQLVKPGADSDGRILLPLAFCRECGQEYLAVCRTTKQGVVGFEPRQDTPAAVGRSGDGYLYVDPERPWPGSWRQAVEDRRVPESWLELDDNGQEIVRKASVDRLPRAVTVDPFGVEGQGELKAAYIPAPFAFCLHCGVSYEQVRGKDFAKLATLSQEGRSSATSLVSASIVRSLRSVPPEVLDPKARKLLTFVDNRQDAALQAGHFNDFVQVTQLRGALYRALVQVRDEGEDGLDHEQLAPRVCDCLGLRPPEYTGNPDLTPTMAKNAARTLRDVVAFRLYRDLERGWRVTMPNLEQTGLLEIDYADLAYLAQAGDRWSGAHKVLRDADPSVRKEIMRALLDEMRRALAIDVQYFRDDFDSLQRASEERLVDPWVLGEADQPRVAAAYPQASRPGMDRSGLFLSGRGKLGKFLRRIHFKGLSVNDAQLVIENLFAVLEGGGLIKKVDAAPRRSGRFHGRPVTGPTGYRVSAAALVWRAGLGERGAHDPLTRTYASGDGPRVNAFFRDLYQGIAVELTGLTAREHTAQVDPLVRQRREDEFREGRLPVLYASPTMELGVDIASLNAVMMRNVPPTPANYAQRSGRAGRSGQPALVATYCATGNSHDQYYFRRSERMVAGSVTPPRLDLANEDLVCSHVNAIWLAETGAKLGQSITSVIDIAAPDDSPRPNPLLRLHENIDRAIHDPSAQHRAVASARSVFAGLFDDFAGTTWWDEKWIDDRVRRAPASFYDAFERWRDLYRAALLDQFEQNRRVMDHTLTERDRRMAVGRRKEAETQLNLLKNESEDSRSLLSDFNPYRYLASEGFLPGYSFPRLPLAAYIPVSGRNFGDGDYVQRPRFLAIREFGPNALIYHEGARYQVIRVQLRTDSGGGLDTSDAKRCLDCGYHHEVRELVDRCGYCGSRRLHTTVGLLKLDTVYTKRRERISSDEEERRRAGFKLVTSYRFLSHGARPGKVDARILDVGGAVFGTLTYGDSATVRRTNVRRLRAKPDEPDGFLLDTSNGRWMSEADAADAVEDGRDTTGVDADGNERRRKKRVIPFVEDRRNVLVLTLERPVDESAAVSLMFALERGIEAAFELEDSELSSELLPPDDGPRSRMLFVEAAEGGAGVLRLLQSDPGALAKAAAAALDICHFNPDGTDRGGPHPDRPCARGCYDCLLTYSNQGEHGLIDRQLVRDALLRLAGARTKTMNLGESSSARMQRLRQQSESTLESEFLGWLRSNGLRLPDDAQVFIAEALSRPDYVYRLPGVKLAVFVDGPIHGYPNVAERDQEAEQRLYASGWDVVRFPHDGDWAAIARSFEDCFGPLAESGT